MPIEITGDPARDLTVFTVTGAVRLADLTASLADYGLRGPTRNEIYDIRQLSGERLTADEIGELADYFQRYASDRRPPGSRTAIVVARDIDYGISRMIALMSDGRVPFEVEVFRSPEAAEAWIAGD